jgi:hypothetical protein
MVSVKSRGKSGSRPTNNNISQKSHFLEKGPKKPLAIPDLLKTFFARKQDEEKEE